MMNTIEEEEDYHLPLLPHEIITEILSRLPAESVMRFKPVCRIWLALIVDPIFINMYTRRHYTLNTITAAETEWVVFTGGVSHLQFVKYNNNDDSGRDDQDENPIKRSKPIIYHPSSLEISDIKKIGSCNGLTSLEIPDIKKIGSCNGLIFMTTIANSMFVCNPLTREYVDLPRVKFNNLRLTMRMTTGFGYHSSTNEYKVIIIYYYYRPDSKAQVTIYTLGSGGWRDKGEISHRLIDGVKKVGGVLFNGALHWFTEKRDDIVSFNLADEEFRIVPSPISQSYKYVPHLGLLGGCLYATRRSIIEDQKSTDIWVTDSMEYSWSKKFSISWKSGISNPKPLALLESGRILLHERGKPKPTPFVSYDPETESSVFVGKSKFLSVYTYSYRKTIVSLKALGETGARIFVPDDPDLIKKRKEKKKKNGISQ